ncbi:MAG TPA: hypothetical protein VJ944_05105, partial [Thermoplasmataceae archaeon]|nr:hypothetical protein [Thermoplasmataceae archaeon]
MIMFVIATILGQIAIVGRLLLGSMHLLHLLIATHTAGLVGGWMNLALWAGEAFPQFFGIEVTLLVSIATYLG